MTTANLSVGIKTDSAKTSLRELKGWMQQELKGVVLSINEDAIKTSLQRAISSTKYKVNVEIGNLADVKTQITNALNDASKAGKIKLEVESSGVNSSTLASDIKKTSATVNNILAELSTKVGKQLDGTVKKAADTGKAIKAGMLDGLNVGDDFNVGYQINFAKYLHEGSKAAAEFGPNASVMANGLARLRVEQEKTNKAAAEFGPNARVYATGMAQAAVAQERLNQAGSTYGPTMVTYTNGMAKMRLEQEKLNQLGSSYGPTMVTYTNGMAKAAVAQEKLNQLGSSYGPTMTTYATGMAKAAVAQEKLNKAGAEFGPNAQTMVKGLADQAIAEERLAKRKADIQINSAKLNDRQLTSAGRQASFYQDIQNQLASAENSGRALDKRVSSYENLIGRLKKLQAELSASSISVFRSNRGDATADLVLGGTGQIEQRLAALRVQLAAKRENDRVENEMKKQEGKGKKPFMDDFGNLVTPVNQTTEAVKKLGTAKVDTAAKSSRLKQSTNELTEATRQHREQQAMLHSTLRGVAGGMDNLWLTYGRYVGHMIGAYAAVSVARQSVEKGIEFDYQTKFVAALGQDRSPDAYKTIQSGLLGIKDAPADVNELGRALRVLQQTGVESANGLGLLPTVIAAATLGETTMKTATEDLVGVLEVFNLHSKDPVEMANNFKSSGDIMAYVAQETKANLHDVAAGLQGVTGVAEQYGVKLETAAAAQAMLGKQGIVGQRAGTYSRSMFESLYVPTSQKAEKAFDTIGFSMFDKKTGEVKDNLQGIVELVNKIKEYDPKSQAKLIDTIFPTWGAKQFRAIFNDLDGFNARVAEAGQQTGLLKRQQEELSNSTKYQLQQLGADYSNLLVKAFDDQSLAEPIKELRRVLADGDLQGLLTSTVKGLIDLATWAANNAENIINVGKALATWGVFQMLSGTVGMLTRALALLGPVVVTTASALAGGGSAIAAFAAISTGAASAVGGGTGLAAALKLLPGWLGASLSPLAAVAGALGPLTIAIGVAGAAWYLFRDRTNEAMDQSSAKVKSSTESMIKDLNDFNNSVGKLNTGTVRGRADAAFSAVEGTWNELGNDRKSAASRFGLNVKDVTGDFDVNAVASKATGSKYNIYPVLDALKKKNNEAAAQRQAAMGLLALAKKSEDDDAKIAASNKPAESTADPKHFDGKRAGSGNTANREAGKLEKQEIANLIKQLATSEQIYDAYYGRLNKLESASADAGLKTREEAENNITSLTAEQLSARVVMNKQFTVVINDMLKNSKNLQGSQREQLEGELDRRQQLLLKLEQELNLNKELATIKSKGAQRLFEDNIEKTDTSIFSDVEKKRVSVYRKAEDPVEAAGNEGRLLVQVKFAEQLRKAQDELELSRKSSDASAIESSRNRLTILTEEIQRMSEVVGKEYEQIEEYRRSAEYGWEEFWRKQSESALSAAQIIEKTMESVTSNLTNEIISFANTGEFNWKKMANSILTELLRMETQYMLSQIFGRGEKGGKGGGSALFDLAKSFLGGGEKKDATSSALKIGTSLSSDGIGIGNDGVKGVFKTLKQEVSGVTKGLSQLSDTSALSSEGLFSFGGGLDSSKLGLDMFGGATSQAGSLAGMMSQATQMSTLATTADTVVTQASAAAKTTDVIATQADSAAKATSAATSTASSSGGWISAIMGLFLADGGAFNAGGTRAFAAGGTFSNSIVNSPTLFKYANGGGFQTGVMGEAGPEAVMPLARDSQGRLGVRYQPMRDASQVQKTSEAPPPPQNNIRIVNAFDTKLIGDYMGSAVGEKVIMNAVKKNQATVKNMVKA